MKLKSPIKTYSLQEANVFVQKDFSVNYWVFIVQIISYPDIKCDPENGQITCPDFIPFKDLALEVIRDLECRTKDIKECQVCSMYFDINKEEGIFGDPNKLNNFICDGCSKKITAKEFYEQHMVI